MPQDILSKTTDAADGSPRRRRPRPGGSPPKVSKQEMILAAAAELFNEHGVGAVSLTDLAMKLRLSRASFYYYVADREDLIFRCYQRSCEADTEFLDCATAADPGLPQVLRYLEESLTEEAQRTAVITDTGLLSAAPRAIIEKYAKRNHDRLAGMIGEGIRLGNVRPCDEQLMARVLSSMVAFYRTSGRWVEKDRDVQTVAALLEFVAMGSAADRDMPFDFQHSADMFSALHVRGLETLSVADLRIEQIMMVGSKIINARGVESLSLEDVVAALGVTRGAVYHYFNDREDLIKRCLERGYRLYDAFIDFAEKHGRNGLEKTLIITHLNTQALVGSLQPVGAWMGFEILGPELRSKSSEKLRKLLERGYAITREGVADGSRRATDQSPITIARVGAYLWIPKWISQVEDPQPHRIADEIARFFKSGLAA